MTSMFSFANGTRATTATPLDMPQQRSWWPCRPPFTRLRLHAVHGFDGYYFLDGRRFDPARLRRRRERS